MARDSGAGAYSNFLVSTGSLSALLVEGEVVGAAVAAGRDLGALHQQVVEQAGGPQAEPVGVQPVVADRLVDQHEVLDGVLGGPDPARGLHTDLSAGGGPEVADRLEHH